MTSPSSRNLRRALVAVVGAATLVLASCGSSTATTASNAVSSATAGAASVASGASSAMSSAMSDATGAMSSAMSDATGAMSSAMSESSGGIKPVATATTATADEIAAAKASLISSDKLTVCTTLPYPPFESATADGQIVGFDMDLTNEIAKDLGVTQETIDTDFTGIKSGQAMGSGICDIAAAAMTINDERKQVISFTDPYYDATQALLVLADSPITGLKDLSGKTVGAQAGTTGKSYADAHAAEFGYTVVEYTSITDIEQAVQSGNVAAGFHDDGPLFDFVNQNPAYKVATTFATGEQYGFGAKLGNTALVAVANAMLKRIMADGTYEQIKSKWIKVG